MNSFVILHDHCPIVSIVYEGLCPLTPTQILNIYAEKYDVDKDMLTYKIVNVIPMEKITCE